MSTLQLVTFDVYITPKSMNAGGGGSRTHWAVGAREKKLWEESIMAEFMVGRVARGGERVEAEVTLNWKRDRRRDVTNYYSTVIKPLADACVKWGLISDDTDDLFRVVRFAAKSYAHRLDEWPALAGRLQGFATIKLEVTYP